MRKDWLQEEDILAFDKVEPFNPPPERGIVPQANHMLLDRQPARVPPADSVTIERLNKASGRYDLPPYWSRRATGDARSASQPRDMAPVPCCTGAMRTSVQYSGRRVLCVSCKTIYRFGRPIGHAAATRLGPGRRP